MDGASKFVRGDAIAGLLIVFINVIGGMIIGIAQQGMPFADAGAHLHAADRRRRPRHADPGADRLDRRRPAGLQGRRRAAPPTRRCWRSSPAIPKALGMSGAVMVVHGAAARHADAAVPGARRRRRRARLRDRQAPEGGRRDASRQDRRRPKAAAGRGADRRPRSRSTTSRSSSATRCCRWSTRPTAATALTEQIKALRRSLAIEMGFVMPAVRILDNVQLEANSLRHQDQGGRGRHRPASGRASTWSWTRPARR